MAGIGRLPIVFVPGGVLPANLSYQNLLQEIKDDVDAVTKDLEIYAGDTPPDDYNLDIEVEGIRRAADQAGFSSFHLVGYSGGGAASLAFTTRYPERVRSLALIEPAWAGNEDWAPAEVAYGEEIDRIMALPPAERMEAFARLNAGSGKVAPPSSPQPPWMAKRPAGLFAMTRAFKKYDLDADTLRRFERPVYIAVGGLSHPAERSKAERLARILPDVRVEVYQDRQHLDPPHRSEASRFARALRDLWERAERQQARAA